MRVGRWPAPRPLPALGLAPDWWAAPRLTGPAGAAVAGPLASRLWAAHLPGPRGLPRGPWLAQVPVFFVVFV